MSEPQLVTVLRPPLSEPDAGRLRDAIDGQSRPAQRVIDVGRIGTRAADLDRGLREAERSGVDWVWLLDGSVLPAPNALERLLAVIEDLGSLPPPILLSSTSWLAPDQLDPARAPWPRLTVKQVALDACERGLVSIRAARHGSLLVDRRALSAHTLPLVAYGDETEDIEWSARLLKTGTGYAVPWSIVSPLGDRSADGPVSAAELRNQLHMLRGAGWGGEEKLWVGYLWGEELLRALRHRPGLRQRAGLLREVGRGLALTPPAAR